ncbi:hypothetical protein KBB05_01420 [Patescibacteria group bacterium]|nr:hypothetical protein [Patescibacteria group bacterium]
MSIDATTENGTQHIYQRVQVLSNSPYTTTRVSATRNFPYGKTPMSIHIQFNQAFQGTITEYAPTSFDISTINQ